MRGSRGSGDCLHPDDECFSEEQKELMNTECQGRGKRLIKVGMRKYVKLQNSRFMWKLRGRKEQDMHRTISILDPVEHTSTQFRYDNRTARHNEFIDEVLKVPDFELWIIELWHDFLIEPTPYLVASAISYLGFVLFMSRYYGIIWWLACFLFQFVPWEEELGLG